MTTTNNNPEPNPPGNLPHRLFLVSVPRTASNLLVRMLNIHQQPHLLTNQKAGYFFMEPYTVATKKGYAHKPFAQWTSDQKSEWKTSFQAALDELESLTEVAKQKGGNTTIWTKEHAFWVVDPAKNSPDSSCDISHESPFKLTFPEIYKSLTANGTFTFSPHNHTVLPDEYLSTWQFAFIIRHPALAWPSMYKAMRGLAEMGAIQGHGSDSGGFPKPVAPDLITATGGSAGMMSWHWTRQLYTWCCQSSSSHGAPIIIDAHDLIHQPHTLLPRFCSLTNLDPSLLQFSWDNSTSGYQFGDRKQDQLISPSAAAQFMLGTLRNSTGVLKEKAPPVDEIDIAAEAEKWKDEFGAEAAAQLEQAVRDAMPDYEWLRERRMKPEEVK